MVESDQAEFTRVVSSSRSEMDRFCPMAEPGAADWDISAIFARQLALARAAEATRRAWRQIAFDASGRMVGGFNLNSIARGLESSGELVFWIASDAAGRGLATEGAAAVIAHAFADLPGGLGLHKVWGLISPDNTPCRAVAGRLGMRPTGGEPVELLLQGRWVRHDAFVIFAPIGEGLDVRKDQNPVGSGLVEGKPAITQRIFGTGLMSILRTEGGLADAPFEGAADQAQSSGARTCADEAAPSSSESSPRPDAALKRPGQQFP